MENKIYKLKISLLNIKPPIWRRISVKGDVDLNDLHMIIQIAMGWENCHLYEFRNQEMYISGSDENPFFTIESDEDEDAISPDSITLQEVLQKKGDKIRYTYDFGDSWDHTIMVEAIESGKQPHKAVCLTGKRNCPPEDCGGPWGYIDMLEAVKDPKHPNHDDMIEWLGENFDPEYFDKIEVNRLLSASENP